MGWIQLAQDRDHWEAVINTLMSLRWKASSLAEQLLAREI